MKAVLSAMVLPALIMVASGARVLQQVAPGPSSPCLCTAASIFTGQTYCFDGHTTLGSDGSVTSLTATPECDTGGYVTCAGNFVELPAGTTQQYYPDTVVTGEAMNCSVAGFLPSPLAAPASAGAPECTCLPAGAYGTTGLLCFDPKPAGGGPPTPDCTAPGLICSVTTPLSGPNSSDGTAKLCADEISPAPAPSDTLQ